VVKERQLRQRMLAFLYKGCKKCDRSANMAGDTRQNSVFCPCSGSNRPRFLLPAYTAKTYIHYVHTYIAAYIHTYRATYIYIYIYIYIYTYIHTYIHTYTLPKFNNYVIQQLHMPQVNIRQHKYKHKMMVTKQQTNSVQFP
jgi:hypothetical protein